MSEDLAKHFVWCHVQHDVEVAHVAWLPLNDERRYVGWFDQTIGCGVMKDNDERWTIDELVAHWQAEMRRRHN
jgi:hypothetical protein